MRILDIRTRLLRRRRQAQSTKVAARTTQRLRAQRRSITEPRRAHHHRDGGFAHPRESISTRFGGGTFADEVCEDGGGDEDGEVDVVEG